MCFGPTKLLSAEVKNSQGILRIVLPILTKFGSPKFLQNIQIRRELKQEVAKQSEEYLGYFSLLHSVVLVC
jgi:hypothetical protein